jgi:hypothetical protein
LSGRINHHWLPQHHLRLFAGGRPFINLVSRDGNLVVAGAGVRGQCARRRLYRDDRLEESLGVLETRQAPVYRSVAAIASGERNEGLRTREERVLREAMLVQRARTPRNAHVQATSMDAAILSTYADHLEYQTPTAQRRSVIRAIREGKAHLRGSEERSLLNSLETVAGMVDVVADLRLLILNNTTELPFVMGDTPCLSSNHYMREVEGFGVLGLAQRGFMLSMPLNPTTHVLLLDSVVYKAADYSNSVVDVSSERDIAALNAFQVCGAVDNVYFSNAKDADRVQSLVRSLPAGVQDHEGRFQMLTPGGRIPDRNDPTPEVMHMYEPQLPVILGLSFVKTLPMPSNADITIPRRPKLIEHLEAARRGGREPGSVGIDEIVRLVESELVVSEDA